MNYYVGILAALFVYVLPAAAQPGWFEQASGGDQAWFSVDMLDAATITAVGSDGAITHSTNGGASWNPIPSGTQSVLRRIRYHSPTLGVVLGNDGVILKSTDAGASWTALQSGTTKGLYDVHFFDELRWNAVGQAAYITETTDGGTTWKEKDSGTNNWNCIDFYGTFGVIVGNKGDIAVTTNGGGRWNSRSSPIGLELRGVSIGDDSTAVAVGINGTLIRTTNKGRDWTVNYASIPMSQFRIAGVEHLTRDKIIAVAYGGIIIESINGGASWEPQTSNTGANLECVSFADSKIGVAVGWNGTIMGTTNAGSLSVHRQGSALAQGLRIIEQYPAPLRRGTTSAGILRLNLEHSGPVTITAVDVLGRSRGILFDGLLTTGEHSLSIQASTLAPGSYILHIAQGPRSVAGRIIVE